MNEGHRISASTAPASPAFPAGFLGIVMLDTRFPRPPGDIGHPQTFAVASRRRVLPGAWPERVVQSAAGLRTSELPERFCALAQQLEAEGAAAITTSCGFLVLLQHELQAAVSVPVVSSSLLLLPALLRRHARVGVLTISAARLGHEHLLCAGVPSDRLADVVVRGVDPAGEFATAILGNRPAMDLERAQDEVVAAAQALGAQAPLVEALVLECTNMPSYAAAIERATGMHAFSLRDSPALRRAFGGAL
jgi:Asp/Glu/Hydantoin racemase